MVRRWLCSNGGEKLERQKLQKKHQQSGEISDKIITESPTETALIIQAYGQYVEENPFAVDILDVSVLPHPKVKIVNAFLLEIYLKNPEFNKNLLKHMVADLAHFQPGIGNEVLRPLGVDLDSADFSHLDDAQRYEAMKNLLNNSNRERYQEKIVSVEKERAHLEHLAVLAETSRVQIKA